MNNKEGPLIEIVYGGGFLFRLLIRIRSFLFSALLIIIIVIFHLILSKTYDISPTSAYTSVLPEEVVVIDAGHGGEDGGAISISGAIESQLNLAVALRLDAVFGLYGVNTLLLRNRDISLHEPDAQTLREKKISDLHTRVNIIESLDNPILISIHQNIFSDSKYHGAQVFYSNEPLSLPFAQITQEILCNTLDPTNLRKPAPAPNHIYLMNNISCRAILVECGFLSNPYEDTLLQTPDYQKKLALSLAGAYKKYTIQLQEGEFLNAS